MTRPSPLNGFFRLLSRCLARLLLRVTVRGQENVPRSGGVLLTMNHLGGADVVLLVAFTPRPLFASGKSEIMGWRVMGSIARAYGMIPLHRGEPDRTALKRLMALLRVGAAVLIAPEGRESLTGALEEARGGPAFLALHADVPVLPVGLTGTAWRDVLPQWRRLRRPCVTLTFGRPFQLPAGMRRREAVDEIMRRIAALLPPEYRGVYADTISAASGSPA